MKKFLLAAFLCFSAMAMMAENTITVNPASGAPGQTVTVSLDMNTPGVTDVCAFQCDVVLQDGVTLVDPENPVLSSRAASTHVIASNLLEDNKYRLLCYSMTNAVITGTSGDIVSFDVVAPTTAATYSFDVENVEIVSLAEIKAIVASGVPGNLTVASVPGDVDGDGFVNTKDLNMCISGILKNTEGFNTTLLNVIIAKMLNN